MKSNVIILLSTGTFAATFGSYVVIRLLRKYTPSPVNTLQRSGDIELGDYIQSTQPEQINNYPDLLALPSAIYDRIPNYTPYYGNSSRVPSYWSGNGRLPSYFSGGNPPSYHSYQPVDRINCPLEDYIFENLDYILWLILFCVFLLLIRKLIISNKIIIAKILLLSGLSIIYLQFGLIQLAQIIIWIIVLFLFNFLLGINPDYTQFKVIRAMAIIFIINSLIFNNSLYSISILIPFSLFEIDFRDSFEWKFNSFKIKPVISYHNLQTLTKDIEHLLLSLNDDENYSMGLSFISSYKEWNSNKENIHPIFIDDAIIVNQESDPILITQFIMENLDNKGLFISNWLFNDESLNSLDPVILTVTVPIKIL